jgi:hypothetical protein
LGLLPYRQRLFGRYHNLRRKKAARASEVRALGARRLLRLPRFASGQQKQTINHAGKETNALRNGLASTVPSLPARHGAGLRPEARF